MEIVHKWAELASVLGLLVSVIGFAITIANVVKSRKAIIAAAATTEKIRAKVTFQSFVKDLLKIVDDVEHIMQLHRTGSWQALPMMYSSLRRQLLAVKTSDSCLSKKQRADLQGVLQQFSTIAQSIEVALAANKDPDDIPELNRTAADQAEKLDRLFISVRQSTGEEYG